MRNPGCTPEPLSREMTHPSIDTCGGPVSGPFTSSSMGMSRRPMRLVNQLESGTSSSVLTFNARTSRRSPGWMNEWTTKSYPLLSSCSFALEASSTASSSVQIGSSG